MADETPVLMKNVAVSKDRYRKLKTDLRDCMLRLHRELSPDGLWTEVDDSVLDAVTAWSVDVADRGGRGQDVPAATRTLRERL